MPPPTVTAKPNVLVSLIAALIAKRQKKCMCSYT